MVDGCTGLPPVLPGLWEFREAAKGPAAAAPVVTVGGRLSQLLRGDLRAGGPPVDARPSRVLKSPTFGPLGWAGQLQAVTSPAPQTNGHQRGRPGQGAGVPGLE